MKADAHTADSDTAHGGRSAPHSADEPGWLGRTSNGLLSSVGCDPGLSRELGERIDRIPADLNSYGFEVKIGG